MPHHVLHVSRAGVHRAPQLVVQLEDLLPVRPADGTSAPAAASILAGAVVTHFLVLVATQQLPELLGVGQEERRRASEPREEQEGEERDEGHC